MLGRYIEEDNGDNVQPFVEISSTKSHTANVADSDLDWFGNTTLHHCFANNEIIMPSVCKVLSKFPEYALVRNQFGRIPLHYALDRIKVNVDGVKKLIDAYPEGVHERDNDGKTPYDVAVKWKHSKEIKKLLLDVDPSLDRAAYFKIRYGVVAVLYNWLFLPTEREPKRSRVYTNFLSPGGNTEAPRDPDDTKEEDDAAPEHSSGTVEEYHLNTSALLVSDQPSTSVTARGDISEQNSYAAFYGSSKGNIGSRDVADTNRRGSLQELVEEDCF
jgi:ankyrin repeat protein